MDSDFFTDENSRFISPDTAIDYSFREACRIADVEPPTQTEGEG